MNMDYARACIEKSPFTHLGASAKFVLQLLDDADLERLQAMERQQAVMAAEIGRLTTENALLSKLLALETAVREVVGGTPPTGAYPRAVFERIKQHLTPHLR